MVYLALMLFVIGLILLAVEIFLSGFGVFGTIGVIMVIATGVITAMYVQFGVIIVVIGTLVLGVASVFLLKYLKKRQYHNKIILTENLNFEQDEVGDLDYFVGREGMTVVSLRPQGTVDFNGVKIDVSSEGPYIAEGRKVVVTQVSNKKIIVKEVQQQ